jgi:rhamnosyltransferase
MKIAIIGSRGIPAQYGGFEVFCEELSTRLVNNGHDVTVSCEKNETYSLNSYKGVNLEYFPLDMPKTYFIRKIFEMIYDVFFMIKLARSNEIIYLLGMTAGWAVIIPKLLNPDLKIFINIDGVEWKRDKFSFFEKIFLKYNTKLALLFSDKIILDAQSMERHLGTQWKSKEVFIPYGATSPDQVEWDPEKLTHLISNCPEIKTIRDNEYWLLVARLEPENNIHLILDGFLKSNSEKPLIVVGNYSSAEYKKKIDKIIDKNLNTKIIMLGGIYNDINSLNMLRQHCQGYVHGHSVGGTNPSLLEAMIMKNIIFAHDNEFNREVCDNHAIYFKDSDELSLKMNLVENNLSEYMELKTRVYSRVKEQYSWLNVVKEYENSFEYAITNGFTFAKVENGIKEWIQQITSLQWLNSGNSLEKTAMISNPGTGSGPILKKGSTR